MVVITHFMWSSHSGIKRVVYSSSKNSPIEPIEDSIFNKETRNTTLAIGLNFISGSVNASGLQSR